MFYTLPMQSAQIFIARLYIHHQVIVFRRAGYYILATIPQEHGRTYWREYRGRGTSWVWRYDALARKHEGMRVDNRE